MLHDHFDAHLMLAYERCGAAVMCTSKRFVMLSVIGLALAATQASTAVAARKNAVGCGEYSYYRGGRCVDARGGNAGPPTHWHPYDPSNSRSGGV